MNKAQWKAIYDFSREQCCTRYELLDELKANGTVERNTTLEELADYVNGDTYDAMKRFLEENI